RAITLVESVKDEHKVLAEKLIEKCLPHSGNSTRVGITGVPGVGKSSFIETFGQLLVEKGKKLAVLTVDPSSEISKGSILGDKTRMEKLSSMKNVFIRPSPSAGHLGGVARRTREAIILCEAAGYDFILVETVGVGQSETAVYHLTDFFLLLMLTGAGDELQGIKRGIMEMADALLITKADGENVLKANMAKAEYARAMHFLPPHPSGWIPKVQTCSSLTGEGIEGLFEIVEEFLRHSQLKNHFNVKRQNQNLYWFNKTLQESLLSSFMKNPAIQLELKSLYNLVLNNKTSPHAAANSLVKRFIPIAHTN
ncbi:MAG: methylmalonyl Co-A mutase-associated GTPase MeaB, partial [Bacteroidia bacterium]|nr:methylmalonyl Co-A mutase-associated GTPase MeaB [Bacteroidia bacterium]